MKNYFVFLMLTAVVYYLGCSSGEIPTATKPLIELEAAYVNARPILDGKADDAVWQDAVPYILHVDETETGREFNINLQAVWWKEWTFSEVSWDEKAFMALKVSWPDDDKNIDKMMWTYHPQDSAWTMSNKKSDWLLISWFGAGDYTDLWYWDAALTNPLGYAEDDYIETIQLTDSTYQAKLYIDGLNYFNDTEDQQNTWDFNYDDNLTPHDTTDDHPMWAWRADPDSVMPSLPRVYSSEDERKSYLLRAEAEVLKYSSYAHPSKAVSVPGFVLEEPKDYPADIMAAGRWDRETETWTVELARSSATEQAFDVGFNPDDRYYRSAIYLTVGDNSKSPLELEAETAITALYSVVLTFQFVP